MSNDALYYCGCSQSWRWNRFDSWLYLLVSNEGGLISYPRFAYKENNVSDKRSQRKEVVNIKVALSVLTT